MPLHPKARDAAHKKARIAATANSDQVNRALAHYPAPAKAAQILDLTSSGLYVSDFIPLANSHVRLRATDVLMDLALQHYDRVRHDPTVRHFLFTGTFDDGITFEDAPVVDFARIELKVRRLFNSRGLDAICVFEVDVLSKKLAGELARPMLFHVHALCWTRDPGFQPVVCGNELSALAPFQNRLGVPGIDFTSRAMSASRHRRPAPLDGEPPAEDPRFRDINGRDQNAWSVADIARYMLKAPTAAKDRYQATDGTWRVCYDEGKFGLNTSLRFAEIWSQITPMDAVFGVGPEGGKLAREFSVRMRQYAASRPQHRRQPLDRGEVARAWRKLFDAHSGLGFAPSVVKHRG